MVIVSLKLGKLQNLENLSLFKVGFGYLNLSRSRVYLRTSISEGKASRIIVGSAQSVVEKSLSGYMSSLLLFTECRAVDTDYVNILRVSISLLKKLIT